MRQKDTNVCIGYDTKLAVFLDKNDFRIIFPEYTGNEETLSDLLQKLYPNDYKEEY